MLLRQTFPVVRTSIRFVLFVYLYSHHSGVYFHNFVFSLRAVIVYLAATNQGQTAADNHSDDERLEVTVFNESIHVTATRPESTAQDCAGDDVTARTTFGTSGRTTLVRVLDKDDIDLQKRDKYFDTSDAVSHIAQQCCLL